MARQRTPAAPKNKPQAIVAREDPMRPGAAVKKPDTKPAAGMMWVRVKRPDGRVEWVQKEKPKPTQAGTDRARANAQADAARERARNQAISEGAPSSVTDTPEDAPPEDGATTPVDETDDEKQTFDRGYWKQLFPGLPDDVLDDLQSFFNNTPNATDTELIGHLKDTDWYRSEFGAFETGVQNGLFGPGEYTAYRAWKSGITDAMGRYGVDAATASTIMDTAAKNAWGADRVEREFAADAYVKANQSDLSYVGGAFDTGAYTAEELKALGQQQVGVGNDLGAQLQTRVQQAFQKMNRLFEGTLAVGDLQQTGQQDRRRRSDVGA